MRWILYGFVFILQAYLCIWTPQLPVTTCYRIRAWQKKSSSHLFLMCVTLQFYWVLCLICRCSCSLSFTSSPFMNSQIFHDLRSWRAGSIWLSLSPFSEPFLIPMAPGWRGGKAELPEAFKMWVQHFAVVAQWLFLSFSLWLNIFIVIPNIYYILEPWANLQRTQDKFQDHLTSVPQSLKKYKINKNLFLCRVFWEKRNSRAISLK